MTISHSNPGPLAQQGAGLERRIVRVDAPLLDEAVRQLVGGVHPGAAEQAHRFLRFASEHRVDLRGMWSLLDAAGRVEATVLAVPNPGRTAMIFAGPLRHEIDSPPLALLVNHACTELGHDGGGLGPISLAQVLLEPTSRVEHNLYVAAGFHQLARLSYLERPLPGRLPPEPQWPAGARLVRYEPHMEARLAAVLEASYEQTLDCPGLRGLRQPGDVLRGHMATGEFDPELWTILELDERPAGALLLNPASAGRCLELVYLGLSLPARGRGLGRMLLRHGLRLLRDRPERSVTLAVDEENTPALRLYESEGFRPTLRRVAMIRVIGG